MPLSCFLFYFVLFCVLLGFVYLFTYFFESIPESVIARSKGLTCLRLLIYIANPLYFSICQPHQQRMKMPVFHILGLQINKDAESGLFFFNFLFLNDFRFTEKLQK